MAPLVQYLTGFGLASGAGGKACIPLLLLGAFHYTPYFELSDQFAWIASPQVMVVLGILAVVEILLDAHPDLGEHLDFLSYLPALVSGFIAFAASTGSVDNSLLELGASGVLGGATATGAHYLRNKVRRPIRDYAEDLHQHVGKAASLGETATALSIGSAAIVVPVLAFAILAAAGLGGWVIFRRLDARRVLCVHCGQPIRPGAVVCIHCKKEQAKTSEPLKEQLGGDGI
jgi:hypothetical protein